MLLYELVGAVVGDSHQIDRILLHGDNMYLSALGPLEGGQILHVETIYIIGHQIANKCWLVSANQPKHRVQ
jgi:hypothetical protein